MTNNCSQISIGEALSENQQWGLELVGKLSGSRDVVFAVDLTESVSLDDEGRLRIRQIIEDSLNRGDTVYIVPFSSLVNPLFPNVNPLNSQSAIAFQNPQEDIDKILEQIPLQANVEEKNTDIQRAEHFIYENLAQINQNRLCANEAIKPQSVVWLTDAPLKTPPGITSDVWIETPAHSPYRDAGTPESIARQNWLNHLPINIRSLTIENYQLSVVDINPVAQEFCTPAPGGRETCLVNSYIRSQLFLPTIILGLSAIALLTLLGFSINHQLKLKKIWKITTTLNNEEDQQINYLKNKQSISIGEEIECLGGEIRGYLKRQGNKIIIEPIKNTPPILYKNRLIKEKQIITNNTIRLNCPHNHKDFEIVIKIHK